MIKSKKKQKFKKFRIFYLLLLLLITTISLSTSSYAWFTTNRLVKIDLLDVSVRAQGGIEISVDGTDWKSSVSIDDIVNAEQTIKELLGRPAGIHSNIFVIKTGEKIFQRQQRKLEKSDKNAIAANTAAIQSLFVYDETTKTLNIIPYGGGS